MVHTNNHLGWLNLPHLPYQYYTASDCQATRTSGRNSRSARGRGERLWMERLWEQQSFKTRMKNATRKANKRSRIWVWDRVNNTASDCKANEIYYVWLKLIDLNRTYAEIARFCNGYEQNWLRLNACLLWQWCQYSGPLIFLLYVADLSQQNNAASCLLLTTSKCMASVGQVTQGYLQYSTNTGYRNTGGYLFFIVSPLSRVSTTQFPFRKCRQIPLVSWKKAPEQFFCFHCSSLQFIHCLRRRA